MNNLKNQPIYRSAKYKIDFYFIFSVKIIDIKMKKFLAQLTKYYYILKAFLKDVTFC